MNYPQKDSANTIPSHLHFPLLFIVRTSEDFVEVVAKRDKAVGHLKKGGKMKREKGKKRSYGQINGKRKKDINNNLIYIYFLGTHNKIAICVHLIFCNRNCLRS